MTINQAYVVQWTHSKMSMLSYQLADLANILLRGLQKHALAAAFSKGRTNKLPSESTNAKMAVRALVALDQICYWSQCNDGYFSEFVVDKIIFALGKTTRGSDEDSEEEHILRYGQVRCRHYTDTSAISSS